MQETAEFTNLINRVNLAVRLLPMRAATQAVNFTKDRFRTQNWVDTVTQPWRQRKKRDKRTGRAILVQSGRLRRSMRKIRVTDTMAEVGTDVTYARSHNDGFRGTINIKQHRRNRYAITKETFTTRSGNERKRSVRNVSGGSTVKAHSRRVNLPRRRFIGASAILDSQIQRMMVAEITRAIKG